MCSGPQQQVPGYGATYLPSTTQYGNTGIQGPRPWTSIPFMQTYGGRPAPWVDQSTQILDAWNMGQNGAGRFGANAASRYGFAGPWNWQQDTRQPGGAGGGGMGGPTMYAGGSPGWATGGGQGGGGEEWGSFGMGPAQNMGGGANGQQGGGMASMPGRMTTGMPEQGGIQKGGEQVVPGNPVPGPMKPPAGGLLSQPGTGYRPGGNVGGNPMQGFQQLLQEDPRAASEALNFNPGWFQANQGALAGMVPGGDLGAWRNQTQPGASNAGPITDEQRALIRKRMGW